MQLNSHDEPRSNTEIETELDTRRIDVIIIIKEEEEYGSAAAICLLLLLPTAEIVYNRPTEFFFLNVQNEKKGRRDVTR